MGSLFDERMGSILTIGVMLYINSFIVLAKSNSDVLFFIVVAFVIFQELHFGDKL